MQWLLARQRAGLLPEGAGGGGPDLLPGRGDHLELHSARERAAVHGGVSEHARAVPGHRDEVW